jgi:hypothetical protein
MGHYYSEAFDDSKQVIHMRFGKPEYNSMISFFTGFFDNDVAQLARTGSVVQDFTYLIGRAVGLVINIIFWPLLLAHSVGYAPIIKGSITNRKVTNFLCVIYVLYQFSVAKEWRYYFAAKLNRQSG